MIRPDGSPHNGDLDGWAVDGCPLTFASCRTVRTTEFERRITVPWHRLILDHRVVVAKEDAPLWSPVILGSSMARRIESVEAVSAIVYDFDGGTKWSDVVDVLDFSGLRFWAYTTFSHSEDHHKFRVVLGLDEAIPANRFRDVWRAVRDMMGWHVDEACKDCSHLYYVPSCPSVSSSPWQHWGGTIGLDWRALLDSSRPAPMPAPHVVAMRRREEDEDKRRQIQRLWLGWCFNMIDPDMVYNLWISFGMAAHDVGLDDLWESWCSRGRKYVQGEPQRKLRSFRR